MSRQVLFVEDLEVEDSVSPSAMVGALQATLRPMLEEEKARIESERGFLQRVYAGMTNGAPIEGSSSIYVDHFLDSLLSELGLGD